MSLAPKLNLYPKGHPVNEREILQKWLDLFGRDVDMHLLETHVTSCGNHLWHLFTWGEVPCLEGEKARRAFDALSYAEAIRFYDGYSGHIEEISTVEKLSAEDVEQDSASDVYITAKDFSWTYVRTHEFGLGPYLCMKKSALNTQK